MRGNGRLVILTVIFMVMESGFGAFVWSTGQGDEGQLGLGPTVLGPLEEPQRLEGEYSGIYCGDDFVLATGIGGKGLYAWGNCGRSQCGEVPAPNPHKFVPTEVEIPGDPEITAVWVGEHTAWVKTDAGVVWGWGWNGGAGEELLGLGAAGLGNDTVPVPQALPLMGSFTKITSGQYHSAAMDASGQVYTWGDNRDGALARGLELTVLDPLPTVIPSVTALDVCAKNQRTHVLDDNFVVYTAGRQSSSLGLGEFGDLEFTYDTLTRILPLSLPPIKAIACGDLHTLVLDDTGGLWNWGVNVNYALGTGDTTNHGIAIAVNVEGLYPGEMPDVAWNVQDHDRSVIGLEDGKAIGWGESTSPAEGALGRVEDATVPDFVNLLPSGSTLEGVCITSSSVAWIGLDPPVEEEPFPWATVALWSGGAFALFGLAGIVYYAIGRSDESARAAWSSEMEGKETQFGGGFGDSNLTRNTGATSASDAFGYNAATRLPSGVTTATAKTDPYDRATRAVTNPAVNYETSSAGLEYISGAGRKKSKGSKGSKGSKASKGSRGGRKGSHGSKGSRGGGSGRKTSAGRKGQRRM